MGTSEGEIKLGEYVLGYHQEKLYYKHGWTRDNELRLLGLLKELSEEGLRVTRRGCNKAIVERLMVQLNANLDMNEVLAFWRKKLQHLIIRFLRFKELQTYSGVTWNADTNSCHAPDPVWCEFILMKKPWMLAYYAEGEKHYELMAEVFLPIHGFHMANY